MGQAQQLQFQYRLVLIWQKLYPTYFPLYRTYSSLYTSNMYEDALKSGIFGLFVHKKAVS